jgi:hypothetical protein
MGILSANNGTILEKSDKKFPLIAVLSQQKMILYKMKKGYGVNLVFQKGKACIFPILGTKLWRQRSQRGTAATKKIFFGASN